MARRLFIDTSAFLALEDKSDAHHEAARRFQREMRLHGPCEIFTSAYVLDETLTLIRRRLGIQPSITFAKNIRSSRITKVIWSSQELEQKALDLFERYADKTFSLTDCMSFLIMQEQDIQEAFSFDDHFSQMGFLRRP